MFDKIINYGDSFTTAHECQCAEDNLWFRKLFKDYPAETFINRAKSGNNFSYMFLEASHDALTQQGKLLQIVSLGVLQRLPLYTDGWYDKETLKTNSSLTDCQKYFETLYVKDLHDPKLTNLYHPTLIYAELFNKMQHLHELADKNNNKIVFVHMFHKDKEYNERHPLIEPFENNVLQIGNYFDHTLSCNNICFDAGIEPVDADKYGRYGHHGAEGQKMFADQMSDNIKKYLEIS